MREVTADILDYPADAIVIPTNCRTNRFGRAVMGRGLAKQALDRYENIDQIIGLQLTHGKPEVFAMTICPPEMGPGSTLVIFPTKYDWRRPSSKSLIETSTQQLVRLTNLYGWQTVALPRVGTGNGGLAWDVVQPILEQYLDERFVIVDNGSGSSV